MEYRMEHDSMGEVRVPADKYWGAQTERSHEQLPDRRRHRDHAALRSSTPSAS